MPPVENLSLEDGELSTVAGRAGLIAADLESDGALVGVDGAVSTAMPGSRARASYSQALTAVNEAVSALAEGVTETAGNAEFAEVDLLSQDQAGVTRLFPGVGTGPTP